MKTQILILVLVLCVNSIAYSQYERYDNGIERFKFHAYGLKNDHGTMPINEELSIWKFHRDINHYSIQFYSEDRSQWVIIGKLIFEEKHLGKYYYTTDYKSVNPYGIFYECVVVTRIDLDEFLKGEGSDEYYAYKAKHEIKIYYDRRDHGLDINRYRMTISVFPIKNK